MSFDKCFDTDAIIIWARVWLSPHSVNQANILQGVGKHFLRAYLYNLCNLYILVGSVDADPM